eukprot:362767-Chlamydomonas_euryale.AAC.2
MQYSTTRPCVELKTSLHVYFFSSLRGVISYAPDSHSGSLYHGRLAHLRSTLTHPHPHIHTILYAYPSHLPLPEPRRPLARLLTV